MRRRITIVIAVTCVMLCFSIGGCKSQGRSRSNGRAENPVATSTPTSAPTATPSPTSAPTNTPRPTSTPRPTATPAPDINFDNMDVTWCNYDYLYVDQPRNRGIGSFSEGYAWLRYYTTDNSSMTHNHSQLVDMDGYIHYNYNGEFVYASPVVDGLTWVRIDGQNVSNADDWEDTCIEKIIDVNGVVHYTTEQIDDTNASYREHIIGYGNGKFLVLKITIGINGESFYLGTIDKDGNVIDEFWEPYGLYERPIAQYLQDDYFRVGDFIYDVSNQTCIYLSLSDAFELRNNNYGGYLFTEGSVIDYINAVSHLDHWGVEDALSEAGVLDPQYSNYDYPDDWYVDNLTGPRYTVSGIRYYRHGFNDTTGNRVLNLEQYYDLEMWCSDFNEDGYAMMIVRGADYYYYLTVIDMNGTELFEPFRILYYCGGFGEYFNFSPYIVNDCFICQTAEGLCLYGVDGVLQQVLVECESDMSAYSNEFEPIAVDEFTEDYVIAGSWNSELNQTIPPYIFY